MTKVFELVRKAARSDANILVLGESGTGKELDRARDPREQPARGAGVRARRLRLAARAAPRVRAVRPREGRVHGRGASRSAGLMEVADRGTLFLDEIGELPLALQAKLLRALQERQLRRVGGTAQIDVDVRVVSATNRDLREAAAKGQFRE